MDAAASVLAFVQVAAQIVNCIVQVNQLWEQVKDLPDEVRDMLSDMEAVGCLFEDIEEQLALDGPSSFRNEASVRRSLVLTRRAHDTLHGLVMDMTSQVKTKKGLKGKVKLAKVIIKKDSLERYRQRLGRSLELLQISIQAYQMALARRSPELISQRVTRDLISYLDGSQLMKGSTITSIKAIKEGEGDVEEISSQSPMEDKALILPSRMAQRPKRIYTPSQAGRFALASRPGRRGWHAYVQWPSWLSQSVFEFSSRPSLAGWTYSYRVYNVVPDHSEIMTKVRRGDKDGVLELFRTRQASPFDKDQNGSSLLHHAVQSRKYEMCKLLLGMGLQECLTEQGGSGRSPIAEFVYTPNHANPGPKDTKSEDHWERIVHLFHSYLDDPESTMILQLFEFLQEWANGDEFVLTFRRRFLPKFYTGPLKNRLEAFRHGSFILKNSRTLMTLLEEGRNVSSFDVELSTCEKLSLVHSAALALGLRFADVDLPYKRLWQLGSGRIYNEEWSEIVTQVASVSSNDDLHSIETVTPWNIHHVPIWRGTPLISVIGGVLCYVSPYFSFVHWNQAIQGSVRQWATDLKAAGVDLSGYGQREAQILREQTRGALDAYAIESSRHMIRNTVAPGVVGLRLSSHEWKEDGHGENNWIPIRIIDIEFGPNPGDWQVLWAPEFEWMACQFWDLIERESIVMPGSWTEA